MTDCEKTADSLVEYINRTLTKEENRQIIVHLASCPQCRKEVAMLIQLRNQAQKEVEEVPCEIMRSAFDKLPLEESEISAILHAGSPSMALDLMRYSLSVVRDTLWLARQAI